jgi:two-component system, OmpR family, KDP operon response regulator KdpE
MSCGITRPDRAVEPVIVLIEDDAGTRSLVRTCLLTQGYRLFEASTGADGLTEAANSRPDVVVVERDLPDMDGIDVVRRLREWTSVPVVVLSARDHEGDKVAALDAGADDYVTRPFGIDEFLARIRVALRHAAGAGRPEEAVFTLGYLRVDLARRRVFLADREVRLTPIEYRLLATLVHHAGNVLTHRQLLTEVWGPAHAEEVHYLRVYMAHLRRKIEADATLPRYLLTEPGVGYRLASQ